MKLFRYNTINRKDRSFNNCGEEKNPNAVNFYASNVSYAERYKNVYNNCGEVVYECQLEVIELSDDLRLFDMNANYVTLSTYKKYVNSKIERMHSIYTRNLNEAKKSSERKMWQQFLDQLDVEAENITSSLISTEFQALSDFSLQNELVAELKSLGFDGYFTTNEVAIL